MNRLKLAVVLAVGLGAVSAPLPWQEIIIPTARTRSLGAVLPIPIVLPGVVQARFWGMVRESLVIPFRMHLVRVDEPRAKH